MIDVKFKDNRMSLGGALSGLIGRKSEYRKKETVSLMSPRSAAFTSDDRLGHQISYLKGLIQGKRLVGDKKITRMATKIRDTFDNTSLRPFKSVDPFNEDNSSEQNTVSARPSDLKPMKSEGVLNLSFKQ